MNQLTYNFRQYIGKHQLFSIKHRLLVGVSGGVDSVVLCNLLKQTGYDFEIAHVNFRLRGPESERDEAFVCALARDLDVPFHTVRFDTLLYAASQKKSTQVAARELRYQWFEQLLTERQKTAKPLHLILTAHHANDNAETILMNLFRGTGIAGLRGILPAREKIRRPLIFANRHDLIQFAQSEKIKWVEDSSNVLDKYARNYIRNTIIPQIEKQYPALVNTLNESANHTREIELFLNNAMGKCLDKLVVINGHQQQIPVERWRKMPGAGAILFAWLKPFGFSSGQLPDALTLSNSLTGHYIDSETHRLLHNRNWLILTPKEEKASGLILLEQEAGTIDFTAGQLLWETSIIENQAIPVAPQIAWLDADKIVYPLLLRPWKNGDYFYPLGMTRKKKVARFLIDAKLSRTAKDQVWVLESDRRIVWVIGQRMDDRFKIKQSTLNLLKFQFNSAL